MDYERYYERRLPEAREQFNDSQLISFCEICIEKGLEKNNARFSDFEKKLKIRFGVLKDLPKLLVQSNDAEELFRYEQIFHAFVEESNLNFDKLLHEYIDFCRSNPGVKEYQLFFILDSQLLSQIVELSFHDQQIIVGTGKGNGANDIFKIKDSQEISITTSSGELRKIMLDRPIREKLDELICGVENHYGIDRTLIETNKVIFLDSNIRVSKSELENICLFLANKEIQNSIYSQDIILFSPFLEEVSEFRVNNSWHRLFMPRFMVDSWLQYLNYFRTWIKQTKGVSLSIRFVEESDLVILKISSGKVLSDYVLGEWLKEYLSFINNQSDPTKSEFLVNENRKGLIINRLKLQIAAFQDDVAMVELLENINVDIIQQLNILIENISGLEDSLKIQIFNGGNNQIAENITNFDNLLN